MKYLGAPQQKLSLDDRYDDYKPRTNSERTKKSIDSEIYLSMQSINPVNQRKVVRVEDRSYCCDRRCWNKGCWYVVCEFLRSSLFFIIIRLTSGTMLERPGMDSRRSQTSLHSIRNKESCNFLYALRSRFSPREFFLLAPAYFSNPFIYPCSSQPIILQHNIFQRNNSQPLLVPVCNL